MPDVVTGSRNAAMVASRMITVPEEQDGLLKGSAWAPVTGRAELLRRWRTVVGQQGKAARGQHRLLRSVAQMLEGHRETLRMMA